MKIGQIRTIVMLVVGTSIVSGPAEAQVAMAVLSPVDHPVISPAAMRTPTGWRMGLGAWGESVVEESLRLRGFNEVIEMKGTGNQGIDRITVKRGMGGEILDVRLIEVKTHRGTALRLSGTRHGPQMSRQWLAEKFRELRRSGDPRVKQLALEISQFRKARGVPIESLGEVHELNPRTDRYIRWNPVTGAQLSNESVERTLKQVQRQSSSPGARRAATRHLAHWDQIRTTGQSQWMVQPTAARIGVWRRISPRRSVQMLSARTARSLARVSKAAGPIGMAIAIAVDAHELKTHVDAYRSGTITRREMNVALSTSAGGIAGAGAGAVAGAYLGAFGGPFVWITIPAGATIGGIVGYLGGNAAGSAISQTWYHRIDRRVKQEVDLWLVRTPYHQLPRAR